VTLVRERPSISASPERRMIRQERLSVSLPADLVEFVKARAELRQEPQSFVVAEALRRLSREDRNRRIIQERIADAEEEQALAAEGMAIAAPVRD
jgi:hypothetical protein